jgi:ribosomal RNA-processing protein 36
MSDDSMEDEGQRLDEEENQIKALLKHTSYETLLKLRKEDSKISMFSKKIRKEKYAPRSTTTQKGSTKQEKPKLKGRPKERDARIPVSKFQLVVQPQKPNGRDPRFDGLSGRLDSEKYQKSYGFLIDQKQQEIKDLESEIQKTKTGSKKQRKKYSEEEIKKLKGVLGKNKEEMNRFKANEDVQEVKKGQKKLVAERVKKGKNPFYLKRNELKNKLMERKFEELDRKKKLDKTMDEKKRKQSQKILKEFRKLQRKTQFRNQMNNPAQD